MGLLQRIVADPHIRAAAEQSPAVRELVARYVAGDTFEQLLPVLTDRISKGLLVGVDYLGPSAQGSAGMATGLRGYLLLLDQLTDCGLAAQAEVMLRPSVLGAQSGPQMQETMQAVNQIARAARNRGIRLCLALEEAGSVETTLALHAELRQDFPDIAVTVQTRLLRAESDVTDLASTGATVRLCKGTYQDSNALGWQSQLDVDVSFIRCLRRLLEAPARGQGPVPLIATHDPRIIEIAEELLRVRRAGQGYEFQMLLGFRDLEQRRLADVGHPVRTYVPFGTNWYDHCAHRLVDRPGNAALFLRSLVGSR